MTDSIGSDTENLVIPDFRDALSGLRSNTHSRDVVRSIIARRLLWAISLLSGGLILATVTGYLTLEAAKDLAIALVAPLLGVFATVVGFFFGAESK